MSKRYIAPAALMVLSGCVQDETVKPEDLYRGVPSKVLSENQITESDETAEIRGEMARLRESARDSLGDDINREPTKTARAGAEYTEARKGLDILASRGDNNNQEWMDQDIYVDLNRAAARRGSGSVLIPDVVIEYGRGVSVRITDVDFFYGEDRIATNPKTIEYEVTKGDTTFSGIYSFDRKQVSLSNLIDRAFSQS